MAVSTRQNGGANNRKEDGIGRFSGCWLSCINIIQPGLSGPLGYQE
jgi:hypothetical protein